ncbi:hypothetical protein C8R44DRAFT_980899 [Mycena epipterygia]|nr:hypothetical protein C8R44DRAFT_980899 [Mycena epipterygia]
MTAAPSPSAQLAAVVVLVKQLFATSFIGFTIATSFYGISILQTYLYYRNYPSDHPALKSTVCSPRFTNAALKDCRAGRTSMGIGHLCTIFVAHSLYTSFILDFGKSSALDLLIPWSFTAEKFLVTLITFIAQCFYVRTIWKISRSQLLTVLIGVLAVVTFALGITTTVHLFQNPLATAVSARSFQILSGLVQGLAALTDVLITVCMCLWLYRHKTGAGGWGMGQAFGTEKVLDSLILYAVSSRRKSSFLHFLFCALSSITRNSITQFMFLTLNLALPHASYWLPFHQAVGKLYVNSVLSTLNVRSTFKIPDVVDMAATDLSFGNVRTTAETERGATTLKGTGVTGSTRSTSSSM